VRNHSITQAETGFIFLKPPPLKDPLQNMNKKNLEMYNSALSWQTTMVDSEGGQGDSFNLSHLVNYKMLLRIC
jgi:hypothetical protein